MSRIVGSYSIERLARRALVDGAASALDLRGNTRRQYRWALSEQAADDEAIGDDWTMVGQDLRRACETVVVRGRV